jgi:Zn-dependent peptidase ImmA (M78 family)
MKDRALITPELIVWARKTSKLSIEEVALKLKINVVQLSNWEKGEDFPTIKQAESLSKCYRRPLAVFYLPAPPEDFNTLRDFRKSNARKDYSTALTFIIRDIQHKQVWISEFLKFEGEEELNFIGRFNKNDNPKLIAQDIIKTLDVSTGVPLENPLKYWIDKIEDQRIFVSQTSNVHSHLKIDTNEVKGFVISDKFAPYIFVNSADSKNAQLFTLIHELAHLWVDATGLSSFDIIDFRDNKSNFEDIELLCNEVAGEILMPETVVKMLAYQQVQDSFSIEKHARQLNVSSIALAVRLLNLKIISSSKFNEVKKIFSDKYDAFLAFEKGKPKSSGGPNCYTLQIRKNSKTFTEQVFSIYKNGRLSGYDASNLLNIKISGFKKLEH